MALDLVCKSCNLPGPRRKGRAICIQCQNQRQRGFQKSFNDRMGKDYVARKNKEYRAKNKSQLSESKKIYYKTHWSSRILYYIKLRAKEKGIPFDITSDDLCVPEVCPVLGITLQVGSANIDSSPSVDRIVPELGYVKGNVVVISHRANRIKGDASLAELEQLVTWLRSLV